MGVRVSHVTEQLPAVRFAIVGANTEVVLIVSVELVLRNTKRG
jgi:hypothetical protein